MTGTGWVEGGIWMRWAGSSWERTGRQGTRGAEKDEGIGGVAVYMEVYDPSLEDEGCEGTRGRMDTGATGNSGGGRG